MKLAVGKRAGKAILYSERTDGEHRQSVALKTERKVAMRWTHIRKRKAGDKNIYNK